MLNTLAKGELTIGSLMMMIMMMMMMMTTPPLLIPGGDGGHDCPVCLVQEVAGVEGVLLVAGRGLHLGLDGGRVQPGDSQQAEQPHGGGGGEVHGGGGQASVSGKWVREEFYRRTLSRMR